MEMPSPVLIIGDKLLSKKTVEASKKKYNQYSWIEIDGKELQEDEIRAKAGQGTFLETPKVILIKNIPKKKSFREFIIDLIQISSTNLKFVIWDSENEIGIDPKTKTFTDTWKNFISEIKKHKNHKVVNHGSSFSEKENGNCISFIKEKFKKYGKDISNDNAILFYQIVGKERGFLSSEIYKLSLTCPKTVDKDFILNNAYPSSKDSVLYQLGNILDTGSYSKSICCLKTFLKNGIHENVLVDIIIRKARWQLAAAYYWSQGLTWEEVTDALMQMGKFPSYIWHKDSLTLAEKKKQTEAFKEIDARYDYMERFGGIKSWQINKEIVSTEKKKKSTKRKSSKTKDNEDKKSTSKKSKARAEVMPMRFMAELTVKFLKDFIVAKNYNKYNNDEMKSLLLTRCMNVYLNVLNKSKEIRYGLNVDQDLQDMIILMINHKL